MQTTFTTEFIYDRIKDSGYPCWALGMSTGFRNVSNVMSYYGNDWTDEDSDETKVDKSINRLAATIASCPSDAVFIIEIKAARNATGSGILGPFQFTNSQPSEPSEPEKQQQPTQQPTQPPTVSQQFSNLGYVPDGYIPKTMLDGLEERMQQRYNADLSALEQKMRAEQIERDFNAKIERLKERENELKDKEKEYNSTVAKAADVLLEVGKRLGAYLLGGSQSAPTPPTPLSGQPSDERAEAIEDVADYLYSNFDLDAIRQLKANLQNLTQHGSSQMANGTTQRAGSPDNDN